MSAHHGGAAFARTPFDSDGDAIGGSVGMSLRDYMATQAMAGLLAQGHHAPYGKSTIKIVAVDAYAVADAMLQAREASQ